MRKESKGRAFVVERMIRQKKGLVSLRLSWGSLLGWGHISSPRSALVSLLAGRAAMPERSPPREAATLPHAHA